MSDAELSPDVHGSSDLPAGLSQPARRALQHAGLTTLNEVSRWTATDLTQLHGIGGVSVEVPAEEPQGDPDVERGAHPARSATAQQPTQIGESIGDSYSALSRTTTRRTRGRHGLAR